MKKKSALPHLGLVLILLAGLAGCHTPPAISTPVPASETPAEASALPVTPPAGAPPGGELPAGALEPLAAANLDRITLLEQVGEGEFGDHLSVSPDGRFLAVTMVGGVALYAADSGARAAFYPTATPVDSIAFSPDGRRLAATRRVPSGEVYTQADFAGLDVLTPVLEVWDLAPGTRLLSQPLAGRGCGQYNAQDLAFSPDGQTIAFRDTYSLAGFARADHICLVSAADGRPIRTISIDLPWQTDSPALFSPDGQQLRVATLHLTPDGSVEGATPQVRTYAVSTGDLQRESDGPGAIDDMALSPDVQALALKDPAGAGLLLAGIGKLLAALSGHARDVTSVAFSPDGKALALGSLDGTASLWSLPEGKLLWKTAPWRPTLSYYTQALDAEIWDLAFSPDGKTLFTLAPTHSLYLSGRVSAVRVSDGEELYDIYAHNSISLPALSPDSSRLVWGGFEDGRAQVWSVARNELLFELPASPAIVLAAAFSPDGERIATASQDGSVRLWRAADGAPLGVLSGPGGPLRAVRFSPDGKWLAAVGDDARLCLWNLDDSSLMKTIPTQTGEWLANSITFSLDGKSVLLAYGCPYVETCPAHGAGDLRRVDLESGQAETLIPYSVYSLSLSADQSAFAIDSARHPQSGRVSQGQYQTQLSYTSPIGNGALAGAALTPDGQYLFSGNGAGLHAWNAASGEMLALRKGSRLSYGFMEVTPDQKMILIAQQNGLVSLWGVPAGG